MDGRPRDKEDWRVAYPFSCSCKYESLLMKGKTQEIDECIRVRGGRKADEQPDSLEWPVCLVPFPLFLSGGIRLSNEDRWHGGPDSLSLTTRRSDDRRDHRDMDSTRLGCLLSLC